MRSKRTRIGFIRAVLTILCVTLLGGCTLADPTTLESFATDLLRGVLSALLL